MLDERKKTMLVLALDQFIKTTEWMDWKTMEEWLVLLDELREYKC